MTQREADAAAADADAARAGEEARLARLRAEYEAAIPDEIRERVQLAVERELVRTQNLRRSPSACCDFVLHIR